MQCNDGYREKERVKNNTQYAKSLIVIRGETYNKYSGNIGMANKYIYTIYRRQDWEGWGLTS